MAIHIDENKDLYEKGFQEIIKDIIDNYTHVGITFAPVTNISINTSGSGNGQFTYAEEGDDLSYSPDDLFQTSYIPFVGSYRIGAKANEDSKFVKWTIDGKDYSTNPEITVTLGDSNIELVAVFEYAETESQENDNPAGGSSSDDSSSGNTSDDSSSGNSSAGSSSGNSSAGTSSSQSTTNQNSKQAAQTKVPKTGDSSNLQLYILALVVCALMLRRIGQRLSTSSK